MIRITFTITEADVDNILLIKKKLMKKGIDTNNSEIIRAGVESLMNLNVNELIEIFENIPKQKVGRKKMDEI